LRPRSRGSIAYRRLLTYLLRLTYEEERIAAESKVVKQPARRQAQS